jgi:hypothetical protein
MHSIPFAKILVLLGVQAVFLAVIIGLHATFTLPHARIEGVDCLALPGEEAALRCQVALAPPGPRPARDAGLKVAFSTLRTAGANPERTALGTAVAAEGGLATLPWKPPSDAGAFAEIVPDLQDEGTVVLQPLKPRPYLLLATLSEGDVLILCDVEALLPGDTSWEGIRETAPADWPLETDAAAALDAATQGRTRTVVYLAPGARLKTAEVRAALHARHFPRGPVLFPDAPPLAGSTAETVADIVRKWPYTKCGIARRPAVAEALSSKGLTVLAVGRVPTAVLALPKVRAATAWHEVSGIIGSL